MRYITSMTSVEFVYWTTKQNEVITCTFPGRIKYFNQKELLQSEWYVLWLMLFTVYWPGWGTVATLLYVFLCWVQEAIVRVLSSTPVGSINAYSAKSIICLYVYILWMIVILWYTFTGPSLANTWPHTLRESILVHWGGSFSRWMCEHNILQMCLSDFVKMSINMCGVCW